MALLRYMKPSRCSCLQDPKGSMSVPSQAIVKANKEVQKAMQATKRGPYLQLNPFWYDTQDTTEQQLQQHAALLSRQRANLRNNSWLMADGVSVFLDSYCTPILYVLWLPATLSRKRGSHECTNLVHTCPP